MTATDDPPGKRYDSLESFYGADPQRLASREHDIGLWWRADAGGPLHRAAWVSDTGELYVVRLGPADHGGGQVELLACVEDLARLEEILEGWRERAEAGSLDWLRERAALSEARRSQASPIALSVPPRVVPARRSPRRFAGAGSMGRAVRRPAPAGRSAGGRQRPNGDSRALVRFVL